MKGLFQRRAPGSEPGSARLTLGAFGKHPGWDDHILGIGVETETLAQLKQVLYVGGIGRQIDSGAWEKLETDKRLGGYSHTFLVLRPGHVLLGLMWSSSDGKGRAKYPMVLCIDGEGVSPGFALNVLLPGLEKLRDACKETNSADQVAFDCRSGQEQLRAVLAREATRLLESGPPIEVRRRFLNDSQLGPDRLGFLRAMHELKVLPRTQTDDRTPATSRVLSSAHLRLPLGANTATEAFQLWVALFRCVLPETVPLFLMARAGEPWLDVLINEPGPDAFFCLQASPKALPWTTEIPYGLPPELKTWWGQIEGKFLGLSTPSASQVASSIAPPGPLTPRPALEAKHTTDVGAIPAKGTYAPARSAPASSSIGVSSGGGTVPAAARSRSWIPILVLALVVLVLALGGFWLWHNRSSLSTPASGQRSSSASQPVGTLPPGPEKDRAFQTALAAAQTAQQAKDYSSALAQAEQALKLKPNDPTASALADVLRPLAQEAAMTQQRYQAATNAAALALLQMNYVEATNQAAIALALKPEDAGAAKLLVDSQQAILAGNQQQQFQSALDAAKSAFNAGQYDTAAAQATLALKLKPNDPAAARLNAEAQTSLQNSAEASRKLTQYQQATNAAAVSLGRNDYEEARRQALIAIGVKTNDPAARRLQTRAETGLALATAQNAYTRGDYSRALALCQEHSGVPEFSGLAASATAEQKSLSDAVLNLSKGDYGFIRVLNDNGYGSKPAFTNLMAQANRERDIFVSLQSLRKTNGWQAVKERLADPALATVVAKPPFAELRTWADSQPASTIQTPAQALQSLDTKLEVLLVQFGVFKPTAAEIQSERARQTKPFPSGALSEPQQYLEEVAKLEDAYNKGGWLDQNNRRRNIGKLRDAINIR